MSGPSANEALCLGYDWGGGGGGRVHGVLFPPAVTTALVHFMINLVADLLEYAPSAACVLFMASGKNPAQNLGQQSY